MPYGAHLHNGEVRINNASNLARHMRPLAMLANIGSPTQQAWAQWLIWEFAGILGIYSASMHRLYRAVARRKVPNTFTVPAMNIRTLTFDLVVLAFQLARERNAGAIIFEIARSEIGYTGQSPEQYAATIMAAAIAAGWTGPVFLQGDHFQVSAGRYKADQGAEIGAVEDLIRRAVLKGRFLNIDVDMSTLVDLDRSTLREQQNPNAFWTAHMLRLIRSIQPEGINISVGAEIGEVGGVNSTPADLAAFMAEFNYIMSTGNHQRPIAGPSHMSIQDGTTHGGVPLPDGTIAQVMLDLDVLRQLGVRARRDHDMVVVQHGFSTLPAAAFGLLREAGATECHLATGIQVAALKNIPMGLRKEMMRWLLENKGGPKADQTEEQWWHINAKHALGKFADRIWSMPEWNRDQAVSAVKALMSTIFDAFNIQNTRPLVERFAPPPSHPLPNPRPDEVEVTAMSSGDGDTSDLAD